MELNAADLQNNSEEGSSSLEETQVSVSGFETVVIKSEHEVNVENMNFSEEVLTSEHDGYLNSDLLKVERGDHSNPVFVVVKGEPDHSGFDDAFNVENERYNENTIRPSQKLETGASTCTNTVKMIATTSLDSNMSWYSADMETSTIEMHTETSRSEDCAESPCNTKVKSESHLEHDNYVLGTKASSSSAIETKHANSCRINTYNCKSCDISFSVESELEHHMLSHTSKSFDRKDDLLSHTITHAGFKLYTCGECDQLFAYESLRNKHIMATHKGLKLYTCEKCGKSFSRKGVLDRHLITHTEVKAYTCEECGKSFAHKDYLNKHLVTHTGKKSYCCKECGKLFGQKNNLNTHLATHFGIKPYTCEKCGKSFTQKSALESHLVVCFRVFSCAECGKEFTRKGKLRRHLVSHTGLKA